MVVRIDPNHFSTKSSASRFLVKALVEKQNDAVARRTTRQFDIFLHGMNEMIKIDDPAVRSEALQFWHDRSLAKAKTSLEPVYTRLGLPFHEYQNLLKHRLREAMSMGDLMAKMRS